MLVKYPDLLSYMAKHIPYWIFYSGTPFRQPLPDTTDIGKEEMTYDLNWRDNHCRTLVTAKGENQVKYFSMCYILVIYN